MRIEEVVEKMGSRNIKVSHEAENYDQAGVIGLVACNKTQEVIEKKIAELGFCFFEKNDKGQPLSLESKPWGNVFDIPYAYLKCDNGYCLYVLQAMANAFWLVGFNNLPNWDTEYKRAVYTLPGAVFEIKIASLDYDL